MRTVVHETQQVGLDTRQGLWGKDLALRQFLNGSIDQGGKIVRRPPCTDQGTLDSRTQGLVVINGALTCFHPKGITPADTAVPTLNYLAFDVPENLGPGWQLLNAGAGPDGKAWALIRHDYDIIIGSTALDHVDLVHVWDGEDGRWGRTYVQDGEFPASYQFDGDGQPSLAQSERAGGAAIAGSRLWIGNAFSGRVYGSKAGRLRVWNQRTRDDIAADGEYYLLYLKDNTLGGPNQEFIIPRPYKWTTDRNGYAWYAVEVYDYYFNKWSIMTEETSGPFLALGYFVSASSEQAYDPVTNTLAYKMKITVKPGSVGGPPVLRVRLIAASTRVTIKTVPTLTPVAGANWSISLSAGVYIAEGVEFTQAAYTTGLLADNRRYFLTIGSDATGRLWDAGPVGGPWTYPHNMVRRKNRIYKIIETGVYPAAYTATDYKYPYESGAEDQSVWTRLQLEHTDMAGADDATYLDTSGKNNGITADSAMSLAALKNRLLVMSDRSTQLWAIDENVDNISHLAFLPWGARVNASGGTAMPVAAVTEGAALVHSDSGVRAVALDGMNFDNAKELRVGEPIATLERGWCRAMAYWPATGQLILAEKTVGGNLRWLVRDRQTGMKIDAWGTWSVLNLTDVDADSLCQIGTMLYFRSGTHLLAFNASRGVTYRDYSDPLDQPYPTVAQWHPTELGAAGKRKRLNRVRVVQDGRASLAVQVLPIGTWPLLPYDSLAPATQVALPAGRAQTPMPCVGVAMAISLCSTDRDGWRLQRIELDLLNLEK
jgi:hypothetical protein